MIELDFLRHGMLAYRFSSTWVDRVMRLVTSVSYRFKVNNNVRDRLTPSRSLRQGDPLSPYLCILVFDVLSHMLNQELMDDRIRGVKVTQEAPPISHLLFCDRCSFLR